MHMLTYEDTIFLYFKEVRMNCIELYTCCSSPNIL